VGKIMPHLEIRWTGRTGIRCWALFEICSSSPFCPTIVRVKAHAGPDNRGGTILLVPERPSLGSTLQHCADLFISELGRRLTYDPPITWLYPNPFQIGFVWSRPEAMMM
jgi:hypothetical protein